MGHNQIKWTISEEKALRLIHKTILEILLSQPKRYISLKELSFLLNNRTRSYHIHPQKKHNRLTKYISIKYGSVSKFVESFDIYEIKREKSNVTIKLRDVEHISMDHLIDSCIKRITSHSDWVIV